MCVPHEPWSKISLQFSPSTMWVSGISNSGRMTWWHVPLVSEPSCHPFLEFIDLILSVLEVRALNSQATPKEFSVAQRSRRDSLQQEYGRTLCVPHLALHTLQPWPRLLSTPFMQSQDTRPSCSISLILVASSSCHLGPLSSGIARGEI